MPGGGRSRIIWRPHWAAAERDLNWVFRAADYDSCGAGHTRSSSAGMRHRVGRNAVHADVHAGPRGCQDSSAVTRFTGEDAAHGAKLLLPNMPRCQRNRVPPVVAGPGRLTWLQQGGRHDSRRVEHGSGGAFTL